MLTEEELVALREVALEAFKAAEGSAEEALPFQKFIQKIAASIKSEEQVDPDVFIRKINYLLGYPEIHFRIWFRLADTAAEENLSPADKKNRVHEYFKGRSSVFSKVKSEPGCVRRYTMIRRAVHEPGGLQAVINADLVELRYSDDENLLQRLKDFFKDLREILYDGFLLNNQQALFIDAMKIFLKDTMIPASVRISLAEDSLLEICSNTELVWFKPKISELIQSINAEPPQDKGKGFITPPPSLWEQSCNVRFLQS